MALALSLTLPGCILGHGTDSLVLHDLRPAAVRTVAVVPFTGEDSYPRVTADWVAFRLADAGRVSVVSAERTGTLLQGGGIAWPAEGDPPPETVRAAAALLRCDALVGGRTARSGRFQPEFSVTLRVWDGATGLPVGSATAYSEFVVSSCDHGVMESAARHAADCVLDAFGGPAAPPAEGE